MIHEVWAFGQCCLRKVSNGFKHLYEIGPCSYLVDYLLFHRMQAGQLKTCFKLLEKSMKIETDLGGRPERMVILYDVLGTMHNEVCKKHFTLLTHFT